MNGIKVENGIEGTKDVPMNHVKLETESEQETDGLKKPLNERKGKLQEKLETKRAGLLDEVLASDLEREAELLESESQQNR